MVARTIRQRVEYEIAKRKGSRFIGAACPLEIDAVNHSDRDVQRQVRDMVDQQRIRFPTACHHCYAYRTMDGYDHCSDDGEPHGTAGRPILVALQRASIVDVCVVVSRIFGGVKLGTGGLIRAYGASAQETIAVADIIDKVPMTTMKIIAPFAHISTVKQACTRFRCSITTQEFGTAAEFTMSIPIAEQDAFMIFLQSKSSGHIRIDSRQLS